MVVRLIRSLLSVTSVVVVGCCLVFGAAPARGCNGDCNTDHSVTVDELVAGVSIALGNSLLDQCASFDGNLDRQVTVDELVGAVNSALNGCPFIGQYFSRTTLAPGEVGTLHLITQTNGHATGTLDITSTAAAVGVGGAAATMSVSLTGTVDLDTGAFSLTGSLIDGEETIPVNVSGTLPTQLGGSGTVTFEIGSDSFNDRPITTGNGNTPTPTQTQPVATATSQSSATPTATATATQTVVNPGGQRIVYAGSILEPNIYVINIDGSGKVLIHHPPLGIDANPAWSPDGSKIAFATPDEQNHHVTIGVVNADGSGFQRLAEDSAFLDGNPTWSPDGSKIAFTVGGGDGIDIMNADGSERHRVLTKSAGDNYRHLSWSPNGNQIAMETTRPRDSGSENRLEIWVMNADGTNLTRLTNNEIPDRHPDWQPNGSKIAYESKPLGQNIFLISPGGGTPTQLTNDPFGVAAPAWSHDGQKIAFASLFFGIQVANANGSGATTVPGTQFLTDFDFK